MLEKLDLTQKLEKADYKLHMDELTDRLAVLQRECKEKDIPVIIVFEGLSASGKGTMINQLIHPLDPRGFKVYTTAAETKEEKMYPFLWRFWNRTPAKGRIAVFDRSWYRRVLTDRFHKLTKRSEVMRAYDEIRSFEQQLTKDGTIIIKFFLVISKKEQKKRFKKLLSASESAWRVTEEDWRKNKKFEQYLQLNEEMLSETDTNNAPWTLIEATDKKFATVKILSTVVEYIRSHLEENIYNLNDNGDSGHVIDETTELNQSILSQVDLNKTYERDVYKQKLKKLQKKIQKLHGELYQRRIPVVLAFEGWDAGGKGGAIKRVTEHMDPRGYVVNPVASPNDIEKQHHYLWRFWQTMPKAGHVGIYDRSWYGRVMVERIEGYCCEDEWKRAFDEINQMEKHIADSGAVVIKFWMHIDKEEQLRRFQARQNNPDKSWKITEEDWRNRDKWQQYEEAVNEMLMRTSTGYAPWIIVEGNSKYYARIKVLETVVDYIEKRLQANEISQKAIHGQKRKKK